MSRTIQDGDLRRWTVQTFVTYKRSVVVIAGSKKEARRKARGADWVDIGDEDEHTIRIQGHVVLEPES